MRQLTPLEITAAWASIISCAYTLSGTVKDHTPPAAPAPAPLYAQCSQLRGIPASVFSEDSTEQRLFQRTT